MSKDTRPVQRRIDDAGTKTNEGDIRAGFYAAYDVVGCEHIRLNDPEIDRRLKAGPELVSANFVIPDSALSSVPSWSARACRSSHRPMA